MTLLLMVAARPAAPAAPFAQLIVTLGATAATYNRRSIGWNSCHGFA